MTSAPDSKPPVRWHFATWLVENVWLGRAMLVGGLVYGAYQFAGIQLFPCAFKSLTGLPCPGCGMTRSVVALTHGHLRESIGYHVFGWVMVIFWMLVAVGCVLPEARRKTYVAVLSRWENKTRWGLWFLIGLVAYTLTRWLGIVS